MKIIIIFLVVTIAATSCGTPGRVCGGSGGRRCVEITKKPSLQGNSEIKRNS